jgi:hypothetical protein
MAQWDCKDLTPAIQIKLNELKNKVDSGMSQHDINMWLLEGLTPEEQGIITIHILQSLPEETKKQVIETVHNSLMLPIVQHPYGQHVKKEGGYHIKKAIELLVYADIIPKDDWSRQYKYENFVNPWIYLVICAHTINIAAGIVALPFEAIAHGANRCIRHARQPHSQASGSNSLRKSLDDCTIAELKQRAEKRKICITNMNKKEILARLRRRSTK